MAVDFCCILVSLSFKVAKAFLHYVSFLEFKDIASSNLVVYVEFKDIMDHPFLKKKKMATIP